MLTTNALHDFQPFLLITILKAKKTNDIEVSDNDSETQWNQEVHTNENPVHRNLYRADVSNICKLYE